MPGGDKDDKTTLSYALPIPAGIGSLAHDSGIGAPLSGRFFTAAWIGLTVDNIQDTQNKYGPPEDRAFIFRQPILQTHAEKSRDEVKFKVIAVRSLRAIDLTPPAPRLTLLPTAKEGPRRYHHGRQ